MRRATFTGWTVGMIAFGILCPLSTWRCSWADDGSARVDQTRSPWNTVVRELTPTFRRRMPLYGDTVTVAASGRSPAAPVRVWLWETGYDYSAYRSRPGGGEGHIVSNSFTCYELASESPYAWAVCSGMRMGEFRLLEGNDGITYLAWANTSSARIADVSKPYDRYMAINDYFAGVSHDVVQPLPVGRLVPEALHWGVDDAYHSILVRSVSRLEGGVWVVDVSGPDSDKTYRLEFRNGAWHLAAQ